MLRRPGVFLSGSIVLVTLLLSAWILFVAVRSPASAGELESRGPGRSNQDMKRDHTFEARNTETVACIPSTITITQTITSTSTQMTTITSTAACPVPTEAPPPPPAEAPPPPATTTTPDVCNCPHTTTLPYEGNVPTVPVARRRKRDEGECTCTVTALPADEPTDTATPPAVDPPAATGNSTADPEGALPPTTLAPPGAVPTGGGGGNSTGTGIDTSAPTNTDASGNTTMTATGQLAPTTTAAALETTRGANVTTTYANQPGTYMPTWPTAAPTGEGVSFKVYRNKYTGLWDPEVRDGRGAFNRDVASVNLTLTNNQTAFMFIGTHKQEDDWKNQHEISTLRCDVWGKAPSSGFELDILPKAPFLKVRGDVPDIKTDCEELCTLQDLTIEIPKGMTYIEWPGLKYTKGATSHKARRYCNFEDNFFYPDFAAQVFADGKDWSNAFPEKELHCWLEGHLTSGNNQSSIKLQSEPPYSSGPLTGPNPINITCNAEPGGCHTQDVREIELIGSDHTFVSFEEAYKVSPYSNSLAGGGSFFMKRGCMDKGTPITFRTYKDNVEPAKMGKENAEKKFICHLTGQPFNTDRGYSKIKFNSEPPYYELRSDYGVWIECKDE